MKSLVQIFIVLATVASMPRSIQAQSYNLSWFTIDGGGGASTGGAYAISGTIGQPDAGKATGGNYTLEGGFWSVIQQDGLPPLKIERRGGNLVLSWPADSSGAIVQSATQLAPGGAGWVNFPGAVTRVGD